MTNLLWHQLKIFISIAYNFDNFWSYFLENLSILFSSCTINFYIQLTIVFFNFVYSFCQFCAWIFLFFLHPIYTQSLWLLLQNSAYLYKQIMNRIHMDLYELKWPLFMKEGGIHCNIECKSLKTDFVYFPAFELNWVALLDQWMLKNWLNQKFGFISYLLYTAIFGFQSLHHKLPFKKYPSNFCFHFWDT